MGDPLSAIMCGFFMEDLEEKDITSALEEYRPTLWKRYVNDILEKVKAGHTDHLNTMDISGNIKITHEEEINSFSGHQNSPYRQRRHKNKNSQ